MFCNVLATFSLLGAIMSVVAEPAPAQLGMMPVYNTFDLVKRQDNGYYPFSVDCGPGATCAEACGVGYEQCASNDNRLHCYDPTIKQTCCTNGEGLPCDDGYYCTADTVGRTYCCQNGQDLAACAAVYSVTGGLSSVVATPTSPVSNDSSATAAPITSSPPGAGASSPVAPTIETTNINNSTILQTTATTPPVVQYTGAANTYPIHAGYPALALGFAGVIAAL